MLPVLLVALVFYGVLPLVGAWRARRSWARFRESTLNALRAPEVDFSVLQSDGGLSPGTFRLTGTLEAFEGSDRLWVGNDRVSAAVSLRGVPVYFLWRRKSPMEGTH